MKRADLIIKHAFLVTMDDRRRIFPNGAIAIVGDTILEVGDTRDILHVWRAERVVDASNKAVFPGLVNTHDHLFQVLLKGLGRDKKLLDWLDNSVRRALGALTPERVRAAAVAGCLESLRSGCTTLMDFQYPHGYPGIDEAVLEAFEETGIRGVLARSNVTNRCCIEGFEPPREETEDDFISAVLTLHDKYRSHPHIDIAVAPSIIWEISLEGLKRVRAVADEHGMLISMHLLETPDDDAYTLSQYGKKEIPLLEEIGFLGPDLVAVHCVLADEADIQTFAKHGMRVSHCPLANMILASGVAPIPAFRKAGVPVSLGTDGSASSDVHDMLEVMKAAALLHKCVNRDASLVSAEDVLEMATIEGARCLNMQERIGSLEAGKKADLFVFNPRSVKSVGCADPISALVYSSSEQNIETVVVGGRVLLEDGVFLQTDEESAVDACQKATAELCRETGLHNTHWNQRVEFGEFR